MSFEFLKRPSRAEASQNPEKTSDQYDEAAWSTAVDARFPLFLKGMMAGNLSETEIADRTRALYDKSHGDINALTEEAVYGPEDMELRAPWK